MASCLGFRFHCTNVFRNYRRRFLSVSERSGRTSIDPNSLSVENEMIDLNPCRGTRDFYPEDQRLRTWLFDKWRSISLLHGFEEYDCSVLESEDLFKRKAGDEITSQLFNFVDKGGRNVALRPEMTPSLARMVIAKNGQIPLPLKWFSIPQCWRYERMTRGRRREHYQWNMDIWGEDGPIAEAELLSAAVAFMKSVGLGPSDVGIRVNSRNLLTGLMEKCDISPDKWAASFIVVDKIDKLEKAAFLEEFRKLEVPEGSVNRLLDYLNIRNVDEFSALFPNNAGIEEVRALRHFSEKFGFAEWLEFDPTIVRGLSYYTGITFEGFDRNRELRAVFGGGRYDRLVQSLGGGKAFGGKAVPAVGFGFGDAVIVELLRSKDLIPQLNRTIDAVVSFMDEDLRSAACSLASSLRTEGISADLLFQPKKPKGALHHANRVGAAAFVMLAGSEWKDGKVVVKDLKAGTQSTCLISEICSCVKRIL